MYDPKELGEKSPAELHQRRIEIIQYMQTLPKSFKDAPTEMLQELAFIAGALRRKTAGPPRVVKASKRVPATAATTDELADLLS